MDSTQKIRAAFHNSFTVHNITGRDDEKTAIETFLNEFYYKTATENKEGIPSLYLSGVPGTGKTALIRDILQNNGAKGSRKPNAKTTVLTSTGPIFINCMSQTDSKSVYTMLYKALIQRKFLKAPKEGTGLSYKQIRTVMETLFVGGKGRDKKILLVLDEIDSLLTTSQSQETLYRLFEWPTLAHSRLVLIGIANALDLTERFLPRLKARGCEPLHINFAPYKIAQISDIIKSRLLAAVCDDSKENSSAQLPVFMPSAIEMAARKVEATGDIRKALDICRMALDLAEESSKKTSSAVRVTIAHVMQATSKSLESAGAGKFVNKWQPLSVSAKALLLCRLALSEAQAASDLQKPSVEKLFACYLKLQQKPEIRRLGVFSAVNRSEVIDLVTLLENQGLILLAPASKSSSTLGGGTFGSQASNFKRRKLGAASGNFANCDLLWTRTVVLNFHKSELVSTLQAQSKALVEQSGGVLLFDENEKFSSGLDISTRYFKSL